MIRIAILSYEGGYIFEFFKKGYEVNILWLFSLRYCHYFQMKKPLFSRLIPS